MFLIHFRTLSSNIVHPLVKSPGYIEVFTIRSDPTPAVTEAAQNNSTFHLQTEHRLFVVNVAAVSLQSGPYIFNFFIPFETFVRAIPSRYGGENVDESANHSLAFSSWAQIVAL